MLHGVVPKIRGQLARGPPAGEATARSIGLSQDKSTSYLYLILPAGFRQEIVCFAVFRGDLNHLDRRFSSTKLPDQFGSYCIESRSGKKPRQWCSAAWGSGTPSEVAGPRSVSTSILSCLGATVRRSRIRQSPSILPTIGSGEERSRWSSAWMFPSEAVNATPYEGQPSVGTENRGLRVSTATAEAMPAA